MDLPIVTSVTASKPEYYLNRNVSSKLRLLLTDKKVTQISGFNDFHLHLRGHFMSLQISREL